MYTGLCECCNKEMKACERNDRHLPPKDGGRSCLNRYDVLHTGVSDGHMISIDEEESDQCDECAREGGIAAPTVKALPRLVDDQLGDAFEILKQVQVRFHLSTALFPVLYS